MRNGHDDGTDSVPAIKAGIKLLEADVRVVRGELRVIEALICRLQDWKDGLQWRLNGIRIQEELREKRP